MAPETPGSIHEGGELGYSLSHAYGAAFDNPGLLVAAVGGDGMVLPILHLNDYKLANPTVLARIPESELINLIRGYGHTPYLISGGFDGKDPIEAHKCFAVTLDEALNHIARIKVDAAAGKHPTPNWSTVEQAIKHCTRGLGILEWAGTEQAGAEPDVVLAAVGDVPTFEVLAVAVLLRERIPSLKVRVVNVVDLIRLQSEGGIRTATTISTCAATSRREPLRPPSTWS